MQSTMLAGIASAVLLIVIGGIGSSGLDVRAQAPQAAAPAVAAPAAEDNDPVRTLVGRLDLERHTRPRSKDSRNLATAARARTAIARRSTGSRRSSRATAARTLSAST